MAIVLSPQERMQARADARAGLARIDELNARRTQQDEARRGLREVSIPTRAGLGAMPEMRTIAAPPQQRVTPKVAGVATPAKTAQPKPANVPDEQLAVEAPTLSQSRGGHTAVPLDAARAGITLRDIDRRLAGGLDGGRATGFMGSVAGLFQGPDAWAERSESQAIADWYQHPTVRAYLEQNSQALAEANDDPVVYYQRQRAAATTPDEEFAAEEGTPQGDAILAQVGVSPPVATGSNGIVDADGVQRQPFTMVTPIAPDTTPQQDVATMEAAKQGDRDAYQAILNGVLQKYGSMQAFAQALQAPPQQVAQAPAPTTPVGGTTTIQNSTRKVKTPTDAGVTEAPESPTRQLATKPLAQVKEPPKMPFTLRAQEMRNLRAEQDILRRKLRTAANPKEYVDIMSLYEAHSVMIENLADQQAIDTFEISDDPRMLSALISQQSARNVVIGPNSDGTWYMTVDGKPVEGSFTKKSIISETRRRSSKKIHDSLKAAAVAQKAKTDEEMLKAMNELRKVMTEGDYKVLMERVKAAGPKKGTDRDYFQSESGALGVIEDKEFEGTPYTAVVPVAGASGSMSSIVGPRTEFN